MLRRPLWLVVAAKLLAAIGDHFFFMPPFFFVVDFLGASFWGLAGPVYLGMVCATP